MKITASLALSGLVASALATPLDHSKRGAQSFCGGFGTSSAGPYTLYHNNWGAGAASSGQQCTAFSPLQGDSVSWSTTWSWQGGPSSVKSYSNLGLAHVNRRLSDVRSIPSRWSWTYSGTNLVADVSYDLWLAPSAGAPNKYEIMIWLGALGGAGPISQTGSPIATTPPIAGTTWKLFKGPNRDTTVFSFVAPGQVRNFNGDLNLFFKYLVQSQGVPASSVITALQAGTEPFMGTNAVFKSSVCSIKVV
ncbi:hypothetical protein E4U42_000368 [Claviceps africana]|uniref:Endoglucanase I n=1 Tax=Claviceps africana TaxID=83212 RepID=A0A8K0J0N6_9HYPO|nr:hypothetical protein E4U42_000368 [Claviceps africana]